jgi:hypothetical protein
VVVTPNDCVRSVGARSGKSDVSRDKRERRETMVKKMTARQFRAVLIDLHFNLSLKQFCRFVGINHRDITSHRAYAEFCKICDGLRNHLPAEWIDRLIEASEAIREEIKDDNRTTDNRFS